MATSLLITALLAAASTTASPLLSTNVNPGVLNADVDLQDVGSAVKTTSKCKVYPGDPEWPSEEAWVQLNKLTGNRLIAKPTPLASVCYPGVDYNAAKCSEYTVPAWQKSYSQGSKVLHAKHPTNTTRERRVNFTPQLLCHPDVQFFQK